MAVFATPVPPCPGVTAAFVVNTVAEALGNVNVLAEVAGPDTVKNALAVPPLAVGRMPVTLAVRSIVDAAMSAFTIVEYDHVPAATCAIPVDPLESPPVPPFVFGREVVSAEARFAPLGVANQVPIPVPSPVIPPTAIAVAVIVPLPVAASDAPVPITIAAVVLVEPVIAEKAFDPPPAQADPVARQIAPDPDTAVPSAVATPVPSPDIPPTGTAVAVMLPLPLAARDAPVPTTIAAVVFVELVSAENAPPEYWGMFNVFVPCVQLAAPLDPVVVSVIGRLVRLEALPLAGVPSTGAMSVGPFAKTSAPVPVSPVTQAARLALDGVISHVTQPVPIPDTPVLIGSPVRSAASTAGSWADPFN